ncbi:PQQ-dependent sugar dehydrogenase [Corallococcus sp. AS-1-6]|uniref:PQQ-dependent sugar dehydrogenase n=1 Tax=Corallococcus sp. AS-1-6 TaxID=2874599 RepID=UPI001CC021A2|nr:PQQ-dependent sugar dehydrogenase [Corallococcus sp. AS-1-6]MBZ4376696.1 PQQ-dependent sugar dehydrogenase [Corallococcus sp. AS-1-6]
MPGTNVRARSPLPCFVVCAVFSLLVGCSAEPPPELAVARAGAVVQDANFADSVFVSGLQGPTTMTFAPDGRLFISEKNGSLRVVVNGQLLATPFMTLAVDTDNERGLMGVAFDPNFDSNHYLYVYYTSVAGSIHNRVSRFTANGNVVVPGSELVLADFPTLDAANHNGGAVRFGLDGKLYVSVGENAVSSNSQSLNTPLGKLLRFNPDGSIPTDNPFYAAATGLAKATWAMGLRNPFTFDVQPGTGVLFINDVGEGGWEEINRGQAGANYGWPMTEGYFTNRPELTQPFFAYPHGAGTAAGNCIAGGAFYNPPVPAFPSAYVGQYFFADYTNNWIARIDPNTGVRSLFATAAAGPVDLDVGPDGALYYLARGAGQVGRIAYTASLPPSISQQPASTLVSVGHPAAFTVSASGEPPLTYRWQRDGVDIPGATSPGYELGAAQLTDSGARFRVVVTNGLGSATSAEAVLTVTSNKPPVATIVTPASGATYIAATNLTFSGSASDQEDGALPPGAMTWNITFHHDTHTHPAMADITGIASGSWPIPNIGESSANVWYRVRLTVRDSIGLTHTTYRDVHPVTVPLTVTSVPSGLQVLMDGRPFPAPHDTTGVVGVVRSVGVESPQYANGKFWAFTSWSDGGAQSHTFVTPGSAATYTAQFVETSGGSCYQIQSERSDKWLTVDGAGKVIAGSTTQAGGQIFQLVPNGTRYKLKGSGDAFLTVVANQLTMGANFSSGESFTRIACGYGGRTRVGFQASSGSAPHWKETTTGAPIQSGDGGNGGACNPDDGGAWEGFYLEPVSCPGGGTGPVCGNGTVESGEQCDDGNTQPGDGCDATCHTETSGSAGCFRIQSERTDKWLTVDGAGKVAALGTTQAGGEVFELVTSSAKYKLKGSGGAYLAVVTDQLTVNASLGSAEAFTRHDCGVFGGRNRYGFESTTGTARHWKENTPGAPIQSGNGGNVGVCNPTDTGAWEAFYLEPATCP